MRRRRELTALVVLAIAAAAILLGWPAGAEAQAIHEESRVKAAFLVRFGQFIDWPPGSFKASDGAFVIGVIGSAPVLEGLRELAANRAMPGRAVSVHEVSSGSDLPHMHVLFVGASERERMAQHVASVAGRPVLVVGESDQAIGQGAAINFLLIERRVRFEIALDTAQKAGLVVSSRLLSVAARVYRGGLRPAIMLAGGFPFGESQRSRRAGYSRVIEASLTHRTVRS